MKTRRRFLVLVATVVEVMALVVKAIVIPIASLPPYHRNNHSHEMVLDPEGIITVFWTPDLQKGEVIFEVHARTTGWVAFGFSPDGGVNGSDIVIGWVSSGAVYLQDRHGVEDAIPPLDAHEDWRVLWGEQNTTHTILTIARDVNTCDPQDYQITDETMRLLYSWGNEDPLDGSPEYHSHRWGHRYALVLLPFILPKDDTLDLQTVRLRRRIEVPAKSHNLYWCHIEKLPAWREPTQYVGFKPVRDKSAYKHLHHSNIYRCQDRHGHGNLSDTLEKYMDHLGFECYSTSMPLEFYKCERLLINWSTGSEGEILPSNLGIPLGDGHGASNYLMVQSHYDNAKLQKDITIEWGMDIYYIRKLRTTEVGNLAIGHPTLFTLTIPPRTPDWLVSGHCSSACTDVAFPQDGISVFSIILQAHYLAKEVRVRHFRGTAELPPLITDSRYTPYYQQRRALAEERLVLPGDQITVECRYDSSRRERWTFAGWAGKDELCQAYLSYYPSVDITICRSSTNPDALREIFGIKSFQKDLNLDDFVLNPAIEGGTAALYQDHVNHFDWEELSTTRKQEINGRLAEGLQLNKCLYTYGAKLEISKNTTKYPDFKTPYLVPPDETCSLRYKGSATHARSRSSSSAGVPLQPSRGSQTIMVICTFVMTLLRSIP